MLKPSIGIPSECLILWWGKTTHLCESRLEGNQCSAVWRVGGKGLLISKQIAAKLHITDCWCFKKFPGNCLFKIQKLILVLTCNSYCLSSQEHWSFRLVELGWRIIAWMWLIARGNNSPLFPASSLISLSFMFLLPPLCLNKPNWCIWKLLFLEVKQQASFQMFRLPHALYFSRNAVSVQWKDWNHLSMSPQLGDLTQYKITAYRLQRSIPAVVLLFFKFLLIFQEECGLSV